MNDLVTREHDKFSNKTITETIKLEVFTHNDYFGHPHYFSINLRHVSTPELQTVVMDIDSIFTHSAIGGDLILLINGTKKISLEPHDQWRTSDPIGNGKDSSYAKYYILSKENLRLLCEAKTIDYQFSSYNNHFSSSFNRDVQILFKAMYNAIYDHEKYKLDIAQWGKQQKEAALTKEKQQKEAKELAENQARTQKQINIIWIVVLFMSIGCCAGSLFLESGKLFWIGLAGIIGSILFLIISNK